MSTEPRPESSRSAAGEPAAREPWTAGSGEGTRGDAAAASAREAGTGRAPGSAPRSPSRQATSREAATERGTPAQGGATTQSGSRGADGTAAPSGRSAGAASAPAGAKAPAKARRGAAGSAPSGSSPASKEDGSPHDWSLFRLAIAVYGVLIIAYGVWQVLAGAGSLPGGNPEPGTTIASAYGGLAAVLCGVGAAFVGIAIKFQWANTLGFVCCTVFLGGIGRVLAWAFFGLPHWSSIVLMVLDLVIPPCLLVWYAWITKANRIRREMAAGPRGVRPAGSETAGKR
ncbi:DUF4345 domain-containing protein [Rothia kristinae]|uniref:DUF4345 domain-containing protein n=1 Tax=Rothia kristinae TaxID=37923 RepID=A0A7T4MUM0_9MICC|nr:DUF4345 domain-containing protein [Rothia kristinae]QQC59918.1 DUF4345 domain-containing protein [Rothia kristinae]